MVTIEPMPLSYRDIPRRWWPGHPPVFPDGPPTAADIAEARALFLALDDESQRWYSRCPTFADIAPRARK